MVAAAHVFPNYVNLLNTKAAGYSSLNGSTKLAAALVHSSSPTLAWNATSEAFTTMTGFWAGSGGGALTEESGTGYSRLTLASVTCSNSGTVVTVNCTSPLSWATSTISATYLVVFDFTTGGSSASANDGTSVPFLYQDFGGTFTDTAGTFSFNVNGSGLATWTSS